MLKLKNLTFSGIGRFVNTQQVDLTTLGSLVQIDGENHNTGGSSGSGKSTIFNALDYLLGLDGLPATVLQSRLTKDSISVRGEFELDGKPLLITRNKRGLIIDLDGQVTEGSSKLTEEKLDEILGMSRDLFRKILHKRQKEGGFFIDFTPKEKYKFLTDALDLGAFQKKLEIVEKKLVELENKKNAGQGHIQVVQSSLKATQESILALGLPPIRDIHQPVVLELKGKYDGSAKKFKEVEEKHKLESQELESRRPQISVVQYDSSEIDELDRERKELERRISEYDAAERARVDRVRQDIGTIASEQYRLKTQISDGQTSKVSATQTAVEIKKIRDSICPTCEQSWTTETAKLKEVELLTKLTNYKEKIQNATLAAERLKVIDSDLLILHGQLSPQEHPEIPTIKQKIQDIGNEISLLKEESNQHIMLQNAHNKSLLDGFSSEQSYLRVRQVREIDQVRGQMEVDRRIFEASVQKLKAYDEAKTRYDSFLAAMNIRELEYQKTIESIELDQKTLEKNIAKAEELRKAVKTFISYSFEDALEAIGIISTQLIRCIPNMSNATIQFEGTKETQDGKIKEEVNAVISMDGFIGIPIKSLSGGERSSVDLAVDLSVIDFVESKSNKGIDVFILDEPFTGLDTVSVEMALEVLKNSNSNKRLIVVDHNPIIKECMHDRLIVVRDGETSEIKR